jgi:predicted amidophosphoribosyltransferase
MTNLFGDARWRRTDDSVWLRNCPEHKEFNLIYGRIYTVGEGYQFSDTNQQISNLKIKPSETQRLRWKRIAINKFADELTALLKANIPSDRSLALIPIPPSKTSSHPEYDDRLLQVARAVAAKLASVRCWPVLECVIDRESFHTGIAQRTVQDVYRSIAINESVYSSRNNDEIFCLMDDVLTSGASFSAARNKLLERFPNKKISGVFWAKAEQSASDAW